MRLRSLGGRRATRVIASDVVKKRLRNFRAPWVSSVPVRRDTLRCLSGRKWLQHFRLDVRLNLAGHPVSRCSPWNESGRRSEVPVPHRLAERWHSQFRGRTAGRYVRPALKKDLLVHQLGDKGWDAGCLRAGAGLVVRPSDNQTADTGFSVGTIRLRANRRHWLAGPRGLDHSPLGFASGRGTRISTIPPRKLSDRSTRSFAAQAPRDQSAMNICIRVLVLTRCADARNSSASRVANWVIDAYRLAWRSR